VANMLQNDAHATYVLSLTDIRREPPLDFALRSLLKPLRTAGREKAAYAESSRNSRPEIRNAFVTKE
jgi:hypothetical protein